MGFVQRAGHKKGEKEKIEVHLIQGKDDNDTPVYAYIAIYASQVRDLNLSLITRATDLERYGVILASGKGEPSDEVKLHIQKMYVNDSDF